MAGWLALNLVIGAAVARSVEAETLKILTYNVWHGFWRTPARELLVLPSESTAERRARLDLQLEQLAAAAPDVFLGQEVHPLPWRARAISSRLGHRSIHQLVSCGLRFLHLGIPWAIRSGLTMTARVDLELERLAGPVLSGRIGFCSDWLGLQLEETRRALLGRLELTDGRRLLLATTHLHSSTIGGAARTRRRVGETQRLLTAIAMARSRDPGLVGVIVGGDLNASADSPPIDRLRQAGFVDTAATLGVEFSTYDPWTNSLAARMVKAGGGDPTRSSPRRIDYLFVSSELASSVRAVRSFGSRADGSARDPVDSDHFGVWLELDL